jgi:5-methylcytosine-specific restriction endonuclease McrA
MRTRDVHHIRFRSHGGKDETRNCAAICAVCHADIHAYRLSISGDANGKLKIERAK